jgi:hypothetical protein
MQTLLDTAVLADVFWDIIKPWQLIAIVVLIVLIIVMVKLKNKQV